MSNDQTTGKPGRTGNSGEAKSTRSARPPKPFRKPLKEKKYRKKLSGRIFLEPDRNFLASITTTSDEGRIVLSRELTKDEQSRLKKLRKAAKKNARGPRMVRLAIFAVIVGAVVVFTVVFKDRLVSKGAESLLEGVFEAQVEIDGLTFRPFRGEISFASLSIADRDEPMTNLFEMDRGAVAIDTWKLLSGHVLISELTVDGIRLGTDRRTSGALPGSAADAEGAAAGGAAGNETDEPETSILQRAADALPAITPADLGLPESLDVESFVRDNADTLGSLSDIQQAATGASQIVETWDDQIAVVRSEITDLAGEVQAFALTDFTAVRTVDTAIDLVSEAGRIKNEATILAAEIEAQYDSFAQQARAVTTLAANLPARIQTDYQALVALLPDLRSGSRARLSGVAEQYLQRALGEWYGRIERAIELYNRLASDDRIPRSDRPRRAGYDIALGNAATPRFLLSIARFGVAGDRGELAASAADITSDPDLVGYPTLITAELSADNGVLTVGAKLDGRSDAETDYATSISLDDRPLEISEGLEALGIDRLTGLVSLSTEYQMNASGTATGFVRLLASDLLLRQIDESSVVGTFINDVISGAGSMSGSFEFEVTPDREVRFTSASTNLDDLVADAARQLVNTAVTEMRARLETAIDAYLSPYIETMNEQLTELTGVDVSLSELVELARDREAAAAELESRATKIVDDLRSRLEAEAQAAIDAARAEAEAAAEAARQAAEEAAREAAEEAADRAADTIRNLLPGRR